MNPNEYSYFKTTFGIPKKSKTSLRFLVADGLVLKQYIFSKKITSRNLKKFLKDVFAGKIEPFYRSQKDFKIRKKNFIQVRPTPNSSKSMLK